MTTHALHVVASAGGWAIRRSGAARASSVFATRREAVTLATRKAAEKSMALYIHRRDGTVERKVGT